MPIYDDTDEDDTIRNGRLAGFYDDNWDKIVEMENFLFIFDHLPERMRIIVDFKIEGKSNSEVASILHVTEDYIAKTLRRCRKRFFEANR